MDGGRNAIVIRVLSVLIQGKAPEAFGLSRHLIKLRTTCKNVVNVGFTSRAYVTRIRVMNPNRSQRKTIGHCLEAVTLWKLGICGMSTGRRTQRAVEVTCNNQQVTKGKLIEQIFPCIPEAHTCLNRVRSKTCCVVRMLIAVNKTNRDVIKITPDVLQPAFKNRGMANGSG